MIVERTDVFVSTQAQPKATPTEVIKQVEQQRATKVEVVNESPQAPPANLDVQTISRALEFKIEDERVKAIVITDKDTGEFVREIPANELRNTTPLGNMLDVRT